MNKPLRLALLGIDHPHGADWRELLQNFPGELRVTAIVPGQVASITSLEERFARLPRYSSVEQLLDEADFDAALVALPNDEAPQAATLLAAAGKHLLIEKPGAGSARELDPLLEALQHRSVAFQNGYVWRYDEGTERLRDMVDDGRFGRLISIEMTFATSDIRRRGAEHYLFRRDVSRGGFFNWLACHYIDLLMYVTGEAIVGVTARTDVFGATQTDVEDGGVAIFDLAGGGLATLIGGYWLPRWAGESQWVLRGSERWVHWRPQTPGTGGVLEIHGPQPHWHAMDETFTLPADATRGYGGARGVAVVRDWLGSIASGQPCRNTPRSTRAVLEVLDAIYQSSAEGRRVECYICAKDRNE